MPSPKKPRKPAPAGFPTAQQVMDFIAQSPSAAGKREIARAFGLKGQEKIKLKALLRDMADEGMIDIGPGRAFHKLGGVPRVTVLRVVEIENDQPVAVPERWEAEGMERPRLRVIERGRQSALSIGDRILARTEEAGKGWIAHPMKTLARVEEQMLGVVEIDERGKALLRPVDKKLRHKVDVADVGEAKAGDLVLADLSGRGPRQRASVDTVLGDPFAPRSFSMIAIHKYGIPHVFPEAVIEDARKMSALPIGVEAREDLRHLPIVAIDPADARDHDDAVWAGPDEEEDNKGGMHAIVAIADVSFYVRPGSSLDKEARKRGNSVYFPDQVVPMLPHELSSDMCSLKAGQDRAALVCHLRIGKDGKLRTWRFTRAVIRVAANIAYEDAQAAIDDTLPAGHPVLDLRDTALKPLWQCWGLLHKARQARNPLELDLPERRVVLDEHGVITSVAVRERLDAHQLIEDYMIAANVAAAKALEQKKAPVMYRVHEPPTREKLVSLKEYLATYDIEFALGQVVRPATFNHLIERIGEHEFRAQIMEQILRSQTQAYYAPQNAGHFGLALGSYAHFTSPIRRYADLLVHRSLVGSHGLEMPAPKDRTIPARTSLSGEDQQNMGRVGDMISDHERRAMEAERETVDRYVAAYLSQHVGEVMDTRITGVQNFGFFATIEGLGGDGLVPVSMLGSEYFHYDEASRTLTGEHSGESYSIGQKLKLRLAQADPVSGSLLFELTDGPDFSSGIGRPRGGKGRPPPQRKRQGRPANIRHTSSKRGGVKRR